MMNVPDTLTTSTIDENVEKMKEMVTNHRRIIIREVADDVGISSGSCREIFSDVLGTKHVATKSVPKPLNFLQKQRQMEVTQESLNVVTSYLSGCHLKSKQRIKLKISSSFKSVCANTIKKILNFDFPNPQNLKIFGYFLNTSRVYIYIYISSVKLYSCVIKNKTYPFKFCRTISNVCLIIDAIYRTIAR